ncbi:MAG: hypothetical protein LBV40_03530 [Methanomicrobiales archaeon]|jgi:hypothetical protein|nr:hypothetical protein [Methanomicrobiales archaeon]
MSSLSIEYFIFLAFYEQYVMLLVSMKGDWLEKALLLDPNNSLTLLIFEHALLQEEGVAWWQGLFSTPSQQNPDN